MWVFGEASNWHQTERFHRLAILCRLWLPYVWPIPVRLSWANHSSNTGIDHVLEENMCMDLCKTIPTRKITHSECPPPSGEWGMVTSFSHTKSEFQLDSTLPRFITDPTMYHLRCSQTHLSFVPASAAHRLHWSYTVNLTVPHFNLTLESSCFHLWSLSGALLSVIIGSFCPQIDGLKSHFIKLLVGQFDGVKQSIILSDNQLDNYHTLPFSLLTLFLFYFFII